MNLKSPADHRMSRLLLRFPAEDLLIHEWTSTENGKPQTARFELRRK